MKVDQIIKEMDDPTLKLGDTVRLRVPPKFDIYANNFKIIEGTCTLIEDNTIKLIEKL